MTGSNEIYLEILKLAKNFILERILLMKIVLDEYFITHFELLVLARYNLGECLADVVFCYRKN
jgi:hypothetical protein